MMFSLVPIKWILRKVECPKQQILKAQNIKNQIITIIYGCIVSLKCNYKYLKNHC